MNDTGNSNLDIYWAAQTPDDLVRSCLKKIDSYYQFTTRYGILDKWKRSYLAYYGLAEQGGVDTSRLNQAGTNGELYLLKVNHFRSLLQNLLTLTTSQRPALQPKALNTDAKSLGETVLASSVIDYYMVTKRLEKELKKAVEFGLIAAEGFLVMDWNATAGNIYTVSPNGAPIYDGDVDYGVFHPIDVVREVWSENCQNAGWYIVREFKNKFNLAAKYPELAEDILAISKSPDYFSRYTFLSFDGMDSHDFIPVYRFYHEPCDALPNGRQFEFIDTEVYFNDGPLAYKNLPIYRISPSDLHGTPFGYTVAYDLLGLQKAYDAIMSQITTNQMNYGIQNLCMPRGSEINVVALGQGLNMIEYDKNLGKPEPLTLVNTPAELFNQLDRIQKLMELISGVNAVSRGDPQSSLHSGAALALVAAQAVQFNNGLQQSYNRLLEDVGTGLIEILQEYASTPRIAQIAGKSNRARVQEFKGDDLKGINRVTVEQVNPISKTAAGRLQEAQDLLQNKMITNPQHYFEVITTGNIETLYEHETSEILSIRAENEDLMEGKLPQAVFTDVHREHCLEHATCLSSPEARGNPQIVQNVLAHIQQHIDLLRNTDPQLLMVLNQQPLPPPMPPGPPAGGPPSGPPQGPQGAPPPPGMPQGPAAIHNGTPPLQQQAESIQPAHMPHLPKGTPPAAQEAYAQIQGANPVPGGNT